MTDRTDASDTDAILERWRDALLADLARHDPGLEGAVVDIDAVLGLAGVVAHGVVRPAAPLTAYLVGLAVGRATAAGGDTDAAFTAAASRARELASAFSVDDAGPRPGGS